MAVERLKGCENIVALSEELEGVLHGECYLMYDRDPLFTTESLEMLFDVGVKSVKLLLRSPKLNARAGRFVRTNKESCLERMILTGEKLPDDLKKRRRV